MSPAQLQYNRPKSPPRQPLTHVAVPPITDEELNMRPTVPKSVKEPTDRTSRRWNVVRRALANAV